LIMNQVNNVQPQNQQAQNLQAIGRPQRTQNVHISISSSIADQRYNDLVEGNQFSGLQASVIQPNTKFQTVLFEGLSP
ncbi:25550_t:CDS:1, partial [Gigaspora rosea]